MLDQGGKVSHFNYFSNDRTAEAIVIAPSSINPDFNSGRMQTYNVNVERQLGAGLGVMVGYFGSQGDRLRIAHNVNQPINGTPSTPQALGVEPHSSRARRY